MATQVRKITQDDLLPGDVLLSFGTGTLSDMIRILSGGLYSHAAVWDGENVIEATERGVKRDTLQFETTAQVYVDAYRWQPLPPEDHQLGDPAYPSRPVTDQAGAIAAAGPKFAYDELLMAAFVISVSDLPLGPFRALAREVVWKLDAWVHKHVEGRKKRTMVCTEVVCTSFWQADPNPLYAINIQVGGSRAAQLVAAASRPSPRRAALVKGAIAAPSMSEDEELRRQCARLLLRAAGPSRRKRLRASVAAPRAVAAGPVLEPAGGPGIPLGCVTPRDLQDSPNLKLVGRLVLGAKGAQPRGKV